MSAIKNKNKVKQDKVTKTTGKTGNKKTPVVKTKLTNQKNLHTVPDAYRRKHDKHFNKQYTEEEIDIVADKMLVWFSVPENYWLKDFFSEIFVPSFIIPTFCKRSQYFSYVYGICKDIQESKIVKGGLESKYDKLLSIFTLKCVSGWRETTDKGITEDEMSVLKNRARDIMLENT